MPLAAIGDEAAAIIALPSRSGTWHVALSTLALSTLALSTLAPAPWHVAPWHPGTSRDKSMITSRDAMFSLHVDTARTWRGGQNQVLLTVNGLRALGHRAALVAHPDGELRRRAAGGLELIPIAPRTEMGLSGAWRRSRGVRRLAPDVIPAN